MKKIFTLLTLLLCAVTSSWAATEYTFNCYSSTDYWSTSSGTVTSVKDASASTDFSVVFAKVGSNSNNGCSGTTIEAGYIKLSKGNTLTISSLTKTFVSATIVFTDKNYGPAKNASWTDYFTANVGTLTKVSDTEFQWSGDAVSSLTLTNVKTGSSDLDMRVKTIVINTTQTTKTTVNAATSDNTFYLYNDNASPALSGTAATLVTFKDNGKDICTMSGSMKNGSSNFTIGGNNYKVIKAGKGNTYTITPKPGVTINSATVYFTSNDGTNTVKITTGGVQTESNGSGGDVKSVAIVGNVFTIDDESANSEARIVVEVNYDQAENVDVKVSSAGYATLYYDKNLTVPTGVTAYKAAISGSNIELTDIGDLIPANTGVILKADAGKYTFVTTTADASAVDVSGNILSGTTSATTKAALGGTVFTLGQDALGVVGLRNYTGTDIRAYCAYSTDAGLSALGREFYPFDGDDDVTAIKNVKVGTEDNIYYDLQGRRVLYPKKGLYIVNGKKVIIK